MPDEFQFADAVRERVSLLIGIGGPSGAGKTLSALKIARGIVGGNDRKIFAIDTEQGRMLHYACAPGEQSGPFKFKFRYAQLVAPFTQERYAAAVLAAEKAGAEVVIVDSMSHEHEGVGGLLEQHEALLTKMAGGDLDRREKVKFAAWIEPKKKHNKLVNVLLQRKPHIIFCFRAKDKLAMVRNKQGKMEPVNVGWTAICSDRFEYEMTMLLMLPPNSKGVPDLSQPHNKIQEAHRGLINEGKPIDESLGKALAEWAAGGAAPKPKQGDDVQDQEPIAYEAKATFITGEHAGTSQQVRVTLNPETGEILTSPGLPPSSPEKSALRWDWPPEDDPVEVWRAQIASALATVRGLTTKTMVELWWEANWKGGLDVMQNKDEKYYQRFDLRVQEHKATLPS